jgi:prepilin-type N-terminal cleavage/methylation domain-containing protein
MRTSPISISLRAGRGFALAEMLLAVAVIALLVGISAGAYAFLRGGINADDQATKTIALAADIQRNWRNAGTYATLAPAEINKLALVQKPLKWDGTNVQDSYGNIMQMTGGTASFVITVGGSANPVSREDCATIANRLATGVATNVNIGTSATAGSAGTAGQVSGGNTFKVGATITQANLATGCSESNPVIAASFR